MSNLWLIRIEQNTFQFTDQFLKAHLPTVGELGENVFRGQFIVTKGDFIPVASDASGLEFVQTEKAKFYQLKLDQIFATSHLSQSFLFNEILLLEGLGPRGVKVHFNVHTSMSDDDLITAEDIYTILKRQIDMKDPTESYLAEIEIDATSLSIEERAPKLVPPESSGIDFADDVNTAMGQCSLFTIDMCKELPYNYTIFPNGLGHRHAGEAKFVLPSFK